MTGEATDRSDLQKMQIGEATDVVVRLRAMSADVVKTPWFIDGPMLVEFRGKRVHVDNVLKWSSDLHAEAATLIEAQAAEIEEARQIISDLRGDDNDWRVMTPEQRRRSDAFLSSKTERADG